MITITPIGELVHSARPKKDTLLKSLQSSVGGSIQIYPHSKGYKSAFTAYVNEEGLNLGLAENVVGGIVLSALGFSVWGQPRGPVVLLGRNDNGLSKMQQAEIRDAYDWAVVKSRKEEPDGKKIKADE